MDNDKIICQVSVQRILNSEEMRLGKDDVVG
jgi:hypothetical protein